MNQTLLTVVLPAAVMVGCAGLGWVLNNLANSMPADQRQLWLHRAASVALLLSGLGGEALSRSLTPEEEASVAGSINQFLTLHKVPGKVGAQDVAVVLADLRLKAAQQTQQSQQSQKATVAPETPPSSTVPPAPPTAGM